MNYSPSKPKSDVRYCSDHSVAHLPQGATKSWTDHVRQFLTHLLIGKQPEVQVWRNPQQTEAHPEDVLWNAYDPATGKRIDNVSEAEVRRWLEQR